jgi:hypothetical protein
MPSTSRRQNSQTISWFSDLHKRKLLNMDPPYQRRSVWNQSYKDEFVDTVLLQFPAPAIFLYEEVTPDGTSTYQVVDGKQRLTTVFDFSKGLFPVSEESPAVHLRGKYFEQLSRDEKTAFWTYQFPVEYLPTNDETVINTIFQRINKNTSKLTRQELRHARFGGPFISAAEELTEFMFEALPQFFPRIQNQSRKQMKDVELVANLLLAIEHGPRGYSQDELDEAFSDRDIDWDEAPTVRKRFIEAVDRIAQIAKQPPENPLFKTRYRNQADFYSLFMAICEMLAGNELDCSDDQYSDRLAEFIGIVENESERPNSSAATDYFKATRSNSNDSGPRRARHKVMLAVLRGSYSDYTSSDTQQVQVG